MTSRSAWCVAALVSSAAWAQTNLESTASPSGTSSSTMTAATTATTMAATTTASRYIKVKRGLLASTVKASGTFLPIDPQEIRVRPKAYIGDLIILSAAAPGAMLHAGDTILELDTAAIKRQVTGIDNELAIAQAGLAKSQADASAGEQSDALALKIQQDEVQNAIDGLKWWEKVDGAQMLESAELSVKYANDAVEDQGDEIEQLKKMYKSEELTSATADIVVKRALRAFERAKTSAKMTVDRSERTKQNDYENAHAKLIYNVDQQKQSLDRLIATQAQSKVYRAAGVSGAQLAVEAAQEKDNNIHADLEQFCVKAAGDVTVFYGSISAGGWSGASPRPYKAGEKIAEAVSRPSPTPIVMTAIHPGRLRVEADLPEAKVLLVAAGMKTTLTPTAMPWITIDGTSAAPALAASAIDRTFNLPIELADAVDPKLEPGMKVSVSIATTDSTAGKTAAVLRVPVAAVLRGKVMRRSDDSKSDEAVEVTTGRSDGEYIEIKSGLKEGDEIAAIAAK